LRPGSTPNAPQQRRRGHRGIAVPAQDGVQTVLGEVVEHQVDHGPRVEGLGLVGGRLRVHPPSVGAVTRRVKAGGVAS
jgi:hypothetical protein